MIRRTCVFCGGTPLTNEHAWPEWIIEEAFKIRAAAVESWGDSRGMQERPMEAIEAKVRRICRPCNEGWMAIGLEEPAKPLLLPWIRGNKTRIARHAEALVAAWAVKTTMMLQFTRINQRHVPAQHFRELYLRRISPPDFVDVWIGLLGDVPETRGSEFAMYQIRPIAFTHEPDPPASTDPHLFDGYEATLIVNQLVLVVLGHAGPKDVQLGLTLGPNPSLGMLKVWPLS